MTNFNRLTLVNTVLVLIIAVVAVISYLKFNTQKHIVYIDNMRLFNEFNMTKDIRTIEEAKISSRALEIDSLYSKLKSLSANEREDRFFKNLQQQIALKSKALQESQDNYIQNLNKNVWNRLNTYIKVYAQTNNYEIILGTSGNGNVMFAKETIDITNQIIKYVNYSYEGD